MNPTKIATAREIIDNVTARYAPKKWFVLFSGGRDSLATTLLTSEYLTNFTVVHINTGIGVRQTREFVRETVKEHGWPFIELHPPQRTYEEIVTKRSGFPGPQHHYVAYRWLKERALDKLVRETKTSRHDRVALVTGVRREESIRRMGHVGTIDRRGAKVWVAPLADWTGLDVRAYISQRGSRVNEVSDVLGYSGECLCGAFARPGERELLRTFYPEAEAEIVRLESAAQANGIQACRWGAGRKGAHGTHRTFMPMCVGCEGETDRQNTEDIL